MVVTPSPPPTQWTAVPTPDAAAPVASPTASIARRMTTATLWSWLDQALGRGLTFATSIFLARLLTPADFGVVSFAMVLIGALSLVQDLGATAALVHNRERPERLAGTALTLNLAAATLLFAALALLAPLVNLAGQPGEAANVARVLGIGILISAAG